MQKRTTWSERLQRTISNKGTALCCGLDPDLRKLPRELLRGHDSALAARLFLSEIVDLTIDLVCAYKLQKAFFDLYGCGTDLMKDCIRKIRQLDPSVSIIIDAKIGDIQNTMDAYFSLFFDELDADAALLNPYMGSEVWAGLRKYPRKGGVLLVRTSGPGSALFQEMPMRDGRQLWEKILDTLLDVRDEKIDLIPVISATAIVPDLRRRLPDCMPILVAGIGAQGGSLECAKALQNSYGTGLVVNSARRILFPFRQADAAWRKKVRVAAKQLRDEINRRCC